MPKKLAEETPDDHGDVTLQIQPVGRVEPVPVVPTLDEAFVTLCQALQPMLHDDIPALIHIEEILAWYANKGGNEPIAWQHAIALLEQALGVRMSA